VALARLDGQRDLVQRTHAAELLADPAQLEEGHAREAPVVVV
jgi:hypothetical protein